MKKTKKIYKKKRKPLRKDPCRYFQMGNCTKGRACQFSHDGQRGLNTTLCKYYLVGNCNKGPSCLLSHDTSAFPCKYYFISGMCKKMGECDFSHERFKDEQIMKMFIDMNLKAVYQHYRKGIGTPLNLYMVENGYLQDKLERDKQLVRDVEKVKDILQTEGGIDQEQQDKIELAHKNNDFSFDVLNALIDKGISVDQNQENDQEKDNIGVSSDEHGNTSHISESPKSSDHKSEEDISDYFDPF